MTCKPSRKEPFGRPREYDRDKIAADMIEWAKKPDSINLCKFCCTYDPPLDPCAVLTWRSDPNFLQAYNIVKAYLGARREEWLNVERIHVKAYDLNANTYDAFLKNERVEAAELDAKLKANALKNEAKATEEEKQKVLDAVQRNNKPIKDSSNG